MLVTSASDIVELAISTTDVELECGTLGLYAHIIITVVVVVVDDAVRVTEVVVDIVSNAPAPVGVPIGAGARIDEAVCLGLGGFVLKGARLDDVLTGRGGRGEKGVEGL